MDELNDEQKEIVDLIEKCNLNCIVYIPRKIGSTQMAIYLSLKHDLPIITFSKKI